MGNMKRLLTLIAGLLVCSTACGMSEASARKIAAQAIQKAVLICEVEISETENKHDIVHEYPDKPELPLVISTYRSRGRVVKAYKGCRAGDRIEILSGSTERTSRERLSAPQTRQVRDTQFLISYEHEVNGTGTICTSRDCFHRIFPGKEAVFKEEAQIYAATQELEKLKNASFICRFMPSEAKVNHNVENGVTADGSATGKRYISTSYTWSGEAELYMADGSVRKTTLHLSTWPWDTEVLKTAAPTSEQLTLWQRNAEKQRLDMQGLLFAADPYCDEGKGPVYLCTEQIQYITLSPELLTAAVRRLFAYLDMDGLRSEH